MADKWVEYESGKYAGPFGRVEMTEAGANLYYGSDPRPWTIILTTDDDRTEKILAEASRVLERYWLNNG